MQGRVAMQEMPGELGVVIEPPPRGLRDEEEPRPFRAELLQVRDRLRAVRRIVARIDPIGRLREMPAMPCTEREERVISLADYRDRNIRAER
jgi:hypothetical protein